MNVTIDLPPDQARRLTSRAVAHGQDLAGYIRRVLEADLATAQPSTPPAPNESTLDLLARWDEEDATDDPVELARRNDEAEQLQRDLNATRQAVGARPLFP